MRCCVSLGDDIVSSFVCKPLQGVPSVGSLSLPRSEVEVAHHCILVGFRDEDMDRWSLLSKWLKKNNGNITCTAL